LGFLSGLRIKKQLACFPFDTILVYPVFFKQKADMNVFFIPLRVQYPAACGESA
jgi:hypothetical protein